MRHNFSHGNRQTIVHLKNIGYIAALHKWGELRIYYGAPVERPEMDKMAQRLIHGYCACVSHTDARKLYNYDSDPNKNVNIADLSENRKTFSSFAAMLHEEPGLGIEMSC